MLKRWLDRIGVWIAKSLRGFLDNPLRVVNAAGLAMGAIFIAIGVVLIVAMFSKALASSALAVVIAPELTKMALGLLAVIAVVICVQLGFKDFKARFMGAEIEASVRDEKAAEENPGGSGL